MSTVEKYNITGKHPEEAELERKLQNFEESKSNMIGALNDAQLFGVYTPGNEKTLERLNGQLEQLIAAAEETRNKLFRIDPSKER